ncbi:PA2778 family cysteine peptidase [Ideonella sp. B508-1]|uniref:PA2778 family cysteine peptidase n=1 Tax=Ideonella sp. B508-1 TaxID=137716 RepID=UPI00034C5EE1|nr:PA2778 family cysteine peptidase [Ideonella sp. B508-1]
MQVLKGPVSRRRRLLAWLAGSAWVSAGLTGCASLDAPSITALQARPPADLPRQVLLRGVPFFPDEGTLCGPATLASVLGAAGRPVLPETLTPQVYLPGREGSLQPEMLAAAARQGALAVQLPPRLEAVLRTLAAGQPALVLVNLSLPIWPRWHYAVVVGYDLDQGEVHLHSGTQGDARWSLQTFEHTWARSEHWAMVANPPDRLPAMADATAVQESLLSLERARGAAAARPGWEAAAQRWPDALVIGMGLGNSRYATGDLPGAAQAFEQVARTHDSAAAWNNLAELRRALGQPDAAREAARRAWQRALSAEPAFQPAVRDTLRELGLSPDTLAATPAAP